MSYKYYSLLRPVGPGTIPSGVKIEDVVNFDRRQLVPEIGREAWGYFTATDPLPVSDIRNYDLFYWEDFEWSSPAHGVRAEERLALLSAARVYSRVNEDAPAFLDPLEDSRKKRIISRGDCEDILRAASPAGDRTLVRIKIRNQSLDDKAVRNLDNMLLAKGRLIKKALGMSAYAPLTYRVSGLDVEFFGEIPDAAWFSNGKLSQQTATTLLSNAGNVRRETHTFKTKLPSGSGWSAWVSPGRSTRRHGPPCSGTCRVTAPLSMAARSETGRRLEGFPSGRFSRVGTSPSRCDLWRSCAVLWRVSPVENATKYYTNSAADLCGLYTLEHPRHQS